MKTMCGRASCNMSLRAALVLHVRPHVPWMQLTASGQSDFSQESTVEFLLPGPGRGAPAKHPPRNTSFRGVWSERS